MDYTQWWAFYSSPVPGGQCGVVECSRGTCLQDMWGGGRGRGGEGRRLWIVDNLWENQMYLRTYFTPHLCCCPNNGCVHSLYGDRALAMGESRISQQNMFCTVFVCCHDNGCTLLTC